MVAAGKGNAAELLEKAKKTLERGRACCNTLQNLIEEAKDHIEAEETE